MGWRNGCLVAVCALFAGCTATTRPQAGPSPEGSASWHLVDVAGTRHYQLSAGQSATGAGSLRRVVPTYPPGVLSVCPPPIEVQAQLIVDTHGGVSDVRVGDEQHASGQRHLFIDAVRAAAMQWRFKPLVIDQWAGQPDGSRHQESEARPFSETYVFRFQCHDGRPSTTVGSAS